MNQIPFIWRIIFLAKVFCLLVILFGFMSIVGWWFNIEFLRRVIPHSPSINPTEAILFICSGFSLWLVIKEGYLEINRNISRFLSLSIAFIGLIKLISIIMDFNFPIDQILFNDRIYDLERKELTTIPLNSAFNFILLGLSIFLLDSKQKRNYYEFFSILIMLVALLNLYGYLYGVKFVYGIAYFLPMSIISCISFLLISLSLLFSRPYQGLMAIVIGENPGEVVFWRFQALFLPLIWGWLKLLGVNHKLFSPEFGTAIFSVLSFAMAMFLIGRTSLIQYKLRKLKSKTERILKEDAKRLHSILDNTIAVIYIKDLNGKFVIINKQFEKLYRLDRKEILGKTAEEIFPPNEINFENNDQEIIRTGKSQSIDEKIKSGEKVYSFITIRFPLRDTKGRIYGVCGISTDITKLKEYELELLEKEKRLNAIIENIGEGVVVADSDGKFIAFNQIAEKLLGIGSLEILPDEWSEKYHVYFPDGQSIFPSEELPLFRALKGESVDEVELFIKNPSFPEGRKISVTGRPIIKEDGSIASVVVFRDVTQRRKLQEAVRENEKRLRAILSSIGEGIIVSDQEGKFLLFNKKAEEILGRGAINVSPSKWSEIYQVYYPDGKTVFPWDELPLAKAMNGEISLNVELIIKSHEFSEGKRISITGTPIKDETGKVTAGVVDFRDVTEYRQLEDLVKELESKYKYILDMIKSQPGN